jgi:hypothetical protein
MSIVQEEQTFQKEIEQCNLLRIEKFGDSLHYLLGE